MHRSLIRKILSSILTMAMASSCLAGLPLTVLAGETDEINETEQIPDASETEETAEPEEPEEPTDPAETTEQTEESELDAAADTQNEPADTGKYPDAEPLTKKVEADKVYRIMPENLNDGEASASFTPAKTGYYSFRGDTVNDHWFGINTDGSYTYLKLFKEFDDTGDFTESWYVYLEGGTKYSFYYSFYDLDEKPFGETYISVHAVQDYVYLCPQFETILAEKDKQFTVPFELDSTVECTAAKYTWKVNDKEYTTNVPVLTKNSNDVFDFDSDPDNRYELCLDAELTINGKKVYLNNEFSVRTYVNPYPDADKIPSVIKADTVYHFDEDSFTDMTEDDEPAIKVSFTPDKTAWYCMEWCEQGLYTTAYGSDSEEIPFIESCYHWNSDLDHDLRLLRLEKGRTYTLIMSRSGYYDEDEGDFTEAFCRMTTVSSYCFAEPENEPVNAIKDKTFTLTLDMDYSADITPVSYSWYLYGEEEPFTVTTTPSITLNSNDYFEFDGKEKQIVLECETELDTGDEIDTRFYVDFTVVPYISEFDSEVKAEYVGDTEYHCDPMGVYYENVIYKAGENISFEVLGTGPEGCTVTYQWYDVEPGGATLTKIDGATTPEFKFNSNDYDPDRWEVSKDWGDGSDDPGFIEISHRISCVVTVTKGKETATREMPFVVEYGPDFDEDYPDSIIVAGYGDSVNISGIDLDYVDGLDIEYQWEDSYSDNPLGTGKNITIDTSELVTNDYSEGVKSCILLRVMIKDKASGLYMTSSGNCYWIDVYYSDTITPDGIEINGTNFPDTEFRKYIATFDCDGSGYLSDDEISPTWTIEVPNLGIKDLKGIEYFDEMTYLDCSGNSISSLDLSSNGSLSELDCSNNQITSLNLTGCSELVAADISHNNISSIDLSTCDSLLDIYTNGPRYRFDNNVSVYGDYIISEGGELDATGCPSLLIDDKTTVKNATPAVPENQEVTYSWKMINKKWYYAGSDGSYATGLTEIDGSSYFFGNDGAMKTGWINDDGNYLYANKSGALLTGWQKISKVWYYLDPESFVMVTGLCEIDGTLYWFKSSGALASGWYKNEDGSYYYFTTNGAVTGWKQISKVWYYFDKGNMLMVTGVREIDGAIYLFSSGGAMQKSGWKQSGSDWYYLTKSGSAYVSKWLKSGKKWYYFKEDGKMAAGESLEIDGKVYEFDGSGAMK